MRGLLDGGIVEALAWLCAIASALGALVLRRERSRHAEAVARACHEVRGPLAALRLGLASRSGTPLGCDLERALDLELERARVALDDLTRVREAARGQRSPRMERLDRFALPELLREVACAAGARAATSERRVSVSWEGPEAVMWGDRVRLAQALANLVANALEHGGGDVCLRGRVRGAKARIAVSDEGPGLPTSVAELARRPRGGRGRRGRGLAIAAEIASAHGGTLATRPVGRGAAVELAVPVSPAV